MTQRDQCSSRRSPVRIGFTIAGLLAATCGVLLLVLWPHGVYLALGVIYTVIGLGAVVIQVVVP